MQIIKEQNNQLKFKAEIEDSLINAIRRYVNHIPILAIDEVEISKNDSALYDETVAHRLGLVPLKSKKAITGKTETELDLKVKKEGYVYSGDFEENNDIEMLYDKIPLTHLNKGQEIKLKAFVKSGLGVEHAKYSPGFIFYREVFDVKVEKNCPIEIITHCPKNVFEESNGKVIVGENFNCDFCEECIKFCEKKGEEFVKIAPGNEILITIESFGQIDAKDIFLKSIDFLKKDLAEISKKIK